MRNKIHKTHTKNTFNIEQHFHQKQNCQEASRFKLLSLKSIEFSQDCPDLATTIQLVKTRISSKHANFSYKDQEFTIEYQIEFNELTQNLSSLRNELENFSVEKGNVQKKENYYPKRYKTCEMLTVKFMISIQNVIHIFHQTDYIDLSKQYSSLYIYIKKFDFEIIRKVKEKEKTIDLFIFRDFEDEIDNLKYNFSVMKIRISHWNLCHILFQFSSLVLKGNPVYNNDISFMNGRKLKDILSDYHEKSNHCFNVDFIWVLLAMVNERIISYYELGDFLNSNKDYLISLINSDKIIFYMVLRKILNSKAKYQNCISKFQLLEIVSKSAFKIKALISTQSLKNIKQNVSTKFYSEMYAEYSKVLAMDYKPQSEIDTFRMTINSTYVHFHPLSPEKTNRIIRRYSSHREMIRVSFKSLDGWKNSKWSIFTKAYFKYFLKRGLILAGLQYDFFGYSNSQFRNMSCWLIVHAEQIRKRCGDFSKITSIAKYGARIGQTLSSTKEGYPIQREMIQRKDDFKINDILFSDGVARLSEHLAQKIAKFLKLDFVPSCFQARFMGNKGVWSVYSRSGDVIYYRPSQEKFICENDLEFEVCEYSRYRKGHLNRQIILLLSTLGVSNEIFTEILYSHLTLLRDNKKFSDFIHFHFFRTLISDMLSHNCDYTNNYFIFRLMRANYLIMYKELKDRSRIFIEKSAILKGIVDEYNVLNYGEAFAIISQSNKVDDPQNFHLQGKYLVTRCPCVHPGDVRKLNFVKYDSEKLTANNRKFYHMLCKLVNVIVFPCKGKRSIPNEMAGGDLDGDDYFVFWDERLINISTIEPYSYPSAPPKNENGAIEARDVIDHFINYNTKNILGKLANIQQAIADKSPMMSADPAAVKLAELFSRAVDAPKSGEVIKIPKDLVRDITYPHYLEKNSEISYHSQSILGKIYDTVVNFYQESSYEFESIDKNFLKKDSVDFKDIYKRILNQNYTVSSSWDEIYFLENILNAGALHKRFNRELFDIMRINNIMSFEELYTGNIGENSELDGMFDRHDQMEYIETTLNSIIKKYIRFKKLEFKDYKSCFQDRIEFLKKIFIKACAFYNFVYDSENCLNIIKTNEEIVNEILSGEMTREFQQVESSGMINSNSGNSYSCINYGTDPEECEYFMFNLMSNQIFQNGQNDTENKILSSIFSQVNFHEIIRDFQKSLLPTPNFGFPWIFFSKYLFLLKNYPL